jgi:hypothetical protein
MGSRERKRDELRKRKRRSVEAAPVTEEAAAGNGGAAEPATESFTERYARRSDERNEAARAKLEPLAEGERPTAVTVATVVAVVLALIFTVSAVLSLATSIEVDGEEPSPVPLVVFAAVLWLMTWGLWRARYWAVLGFQMLLVLFMLSSALGLVAVGNVLQAIGTLALLGGSATLFYFMIRAMARIQMPQRPGEG